MFEDFPPGILLDGLNLRDSVQTKGKSSMVGIPSATRCLRSSLLLKLQIKL
ncbi:hypothetical protein DPMN_007534 [Dreissena polymorpha]|uniref:Uncharacterized protein n=1 Tax=Dreissena polymorpha TaxID=45954 RepID=A0A9D4RWI2_DREPO|nr:hypothetical protein DPMN_006146 [Dreissena polymorpha]KAH3883574.1 hypothetical protein DPMN_007534 [Dreissena polymorpha]